MNILVKKIVLAILSVGVLGVLYSAYLLTHKVETAQTNQLAALLSVLPEEQLLLDGVQKSADCQIQGSLPDHGCSPGAIFQDATKEEICVPGYSATVRKVSTSLKKKVFAEYGILYPVPFGSYEVDHVIPLAIGGSNDIANLFPEASDPYPGFKEKDVVENYLHEEVCASRVALNVAQVRIANNWLEIYNNLDPKIVRDFKNKYHNWSDRAGSE